MEQVFCDIPDASNKELCRTSENACSATPKCIKVTLKRHGTHVARQKCSLNWSFLMSCDIV